MKRDKKEQELFDRLSELYEKATTEEEYNEVVEKGGERKIMLGEDPDIKVSIQLPSYWAEYYLFLKFPNSFKDIQDRFDFVSEIESVYTHLTDPDNKVALLHLESVIWSNLLNNQENSDWCNREIETILLNEEVSLVSILRYINARGIKEMAAKNWSEAVKIFNEIGVLSITALRQPENLRHAGNIFNNRGASKIRGSINITGGVDDLFEAKSFYLREDQPSQKHLEGLRNRLREATKKLEERMK